MWPTRAPGRGLYTSVSGVALGNPFGAAGREGAGREHKIGPVRTSREGHGARVTKIQPEVRKRIL